MQLIRDCIIIFIPFLKFNPKIMNQRNLFLSYSQSQHFSYLFALKSNSSINSPRPELFATLHWIDDDDDDDMKHRTVYIDPDLISILAWWVYAQRATSIHPRLIVIVYYSYFFNLISYCLILDTVLYLISFIYYFVNSFHCISIKFHPYTPVPFSFSL